MNKLNVHWVYWNKMSPASPYSNREINKRLFLRNHIKDKVSCAGVIVSKIPSSYACFVKYDLTSSTSYMSERICLMPRD